MSTIEPASSDIVVSLARGRHAVMSRANALLKDGGAQPATEDQHLQAVSGLLMTSLEELKVAEEELRTQNATLEAQRAGIDARTRYYRELFHAAPIAVVLTDSHGTIVEVNAEAATLLRRATQHLERKPLVALVPAERREAFRQQFTRLRTLDEGVRDWCVTLTRAGDVPVDVHATVKFFPELGPMKSGLFYWLLRQPSTS